MAHQNLVANSWARYADPMTRKLVTAGLFEAFTRNVAGTGKKPSGIKFLMTNCSVAALAQTRAKGPTESLKPWPMGALRWGIGCRGSTVRPARLVAVSSST